jgi:hypothetical protein
MPPGGCSLPSATMFPTRRWGAAPQPQEGEPRLQDDGVPDPEGGGHDHRGQVLGITCRRMIRARENPSAAPPG